jgi:O-antigen/teichoic acid export membrane protein
MSEPDEAPGSFARAFTSLSLASAVSMAANLVRGKLAALFLGPAGVGIFNQLALMWNLFQISGSLGAFNGLVQHGTEAMVAKDEAALHRLASTWWILLTAFSCLLAAAGALASPMISNWLLGDHGAHASLVALMLVSIPFAVSAQVYRALLAAARLVPQLVRAQIISDVGGAIIFAALVPVLGLPGSILGFATIHLLFYLMTALSVRKSLGSAYIRPRPREFSWAAVRSNVGFGISGLAMIALSNLSVVVVSRIVIDYLGIGASGIFSNAWRIATVYLGAVTTTAISYYLPTLTRAESDEQMSSDVNATIRFYLYLLPLVMAAIMAAGEPISWLILSSKFLAVAPLLLLFVPAELMRILGETAAMPLLARRRLKPFTALFALQTAIFVGGAALALPYFGLGGAAAAYGIATTIAAIVTFVTSRHYFPLKLETTTALPLVRAMLLLGAAMTAGFTIDFGVLRLVLIGVACLVWLVWTLTDDGARELLSRLKLRRSGAQ